MSLKHFVIVNDITNLSDARYCAGMGVDVLGFKFDSTKPDNRFSEISEWVAGIDFAASFAEEDPTMIQDVIATNTLSYLMLHDARVLDEIQHLGKPAILRIDVGSSEDCNSLDDTIRSMNDIVNLFYISCEDPSLCDALLSSIKSLEQRGKIVIDFGFDHQNVIKTIESNGVHGIVLYGSEEDQTGFKDYGEMMDILEALEED